MTLTDVSDPQIGSPRKPLVERRFSTPGVHPYDEVTWTRRDVVQENYKTGKVIFEQRGVEFPDFWSVNASTIVTTKYFRGAVGSPERESSLKDLIDRVVGKYTWAAVEHGYLSEAEAEVFSDELTWLLLHQHFAFNSPVWFNVGTKSSQQVSACFILSVDDSMDSILNWYKEEGFIFKGGSGAGLNLSRIRSSKELLTSGGTASGPVSFMRGADASAGSIKSGGSTRRAAKMVVLDVDHPDIEEFVMTKAREEDKIRALRDAGFDMDLGGADISSVQYQNANNSVSVSDEFMRAVEAGERFGLRARTTGEIIEYVEARDLFHKIAQAAWECADPGLHYNDTMNAWHTNPATGPITASNPCSEFVFLDNTSCNLASLNLLKFTDPTTGAFDVDRFVAATEIVFLAMDISIAFGDFPTEAITRMSKDHRPLGIGYANLGAFLMTRGLAYDSPQGRDLAAAITSLMTGTAYRKSTEIAAVVGPYAAYAANAEGHMRVMRKHRDNAAALVEASLDVTGQTKFPLLESDVTGIVSGHMEASLIANQALVAWEQGIYQGGEFGYRNSQASLLAPTGTIGFMMDCDTTGIEPDFSLVKHKKMSDGGSMKIVNNQVAPALRNLGYDERAIEAIIGYVAEEGHVVGAPGLDESHYPVFDCAVGLRSIEAMGHVRMMAAVQPFLSGAISKTVNLPQTATVEEIESVYLDSWRLGLKATAVYRDNCKAFQPLNDAKAKTVEEPAAEPQVIEKIVEKIVHVTERKKLPSRRPGVTTSFAVAGAEGHLITGNYEDGALAEIFLKMGKAGSTLSGMMDAFSIAISIGLQHGVPLETYVSKFTNMRFEPSGMVSGDEDLKMGQSIVDYAFRRLALDYLSPEVCESYAIKSVRARSAALDAQAAAAEGPAMLDEVAIEPERKPESVSAPAPVEVSPDLAAARAKAAHDSAPLCFTCGTKMRPSGSCHVCEQCGSTSGCS